MAKCFALRPNNRLEVRKPRNLKFYATSGKLGSLTSVSSLTVRSGSRTRDASFQKPIHSITLEVLR